MREFSGIVDLPATLMIVVALFVIALANGFSRRRTIAMAPTALLEASYLFMLITLVAMFEDPLNFMALPYMASFALVTFAIAGVVGKHPSGDRAAPTVPDQRRAAHPHRRIQYSYRAHSNR